MGPESLLMNNSYYEYRVSDFEATMKKYLLLRDDKVALEEYIRAKQYLSYQAMVVCQSHVDPLFCH